MGNVYRQDLQRLTKESFEVQCHIADRTVPRQALIMGLPLTAPPATKEPLRGILVAPSTATKSPITSTLEKWAEERDSLHSLHHEPLSRKSLPLEAVIQYQVGTCEVLVLA